MVMHYKKKGAPEWRCRRHLFKATYPHDDALPEDPDAWPIEPDEPTDHPQPLLEDDLFDLIESDFSNMEDNK